MDNVYQAPLPKWVRLKKYTEMSGITRTAFHQKIGKGQLAEGMHWKKAPDGAIMVNWTEMDNWVEHGFKAAIGH